MITINQLAAKLGNHHGVDPDAMATSVRILVDQICADPDLWDAETDRLTQAGADLVAIQVAETYAAGTVATEAAELLEQIAAAEAARAAASRQADGHTARRDELIRAALRTEARRSDIAAAGGIGESRLYQIRDGRR